MELPTKSAGRLIGIFHLQIRLHYIAFVQLLCYCERLIMEMVERVQETVVERQTVERVGTYLFIR